MTTPAHLSDVGAEMAEPEPLASLARRAAYAAGQGLKLASYWAQHMAVSRAEARAGAAPRLDPALAAAMPGPAAVRRDLMALLRRDAENVAAGVYRMPSDHFESPVAMLSRARRFLADASRVRERRARKSNSEVLTPDRHGRFPRYYLQNFHYQTDGYLSPESAALYDHQVEILFGGGADAMRRQALPPIAAHLRAACAGGRRIKDLSLADIACGTGKFLVAVKENYPRLPVTGIELSPDYVAEARRRLEPWSWTRLLEANAERLPLADRSQDVATCIYLFHELPRQVRSRVASEIARILKPGGLFVFVDSIQKG
ncbi:MAG: class I SAM-dependent methyltransferase, partial [Alphaproteobacteria bacterium]|nr:class I SAM-dependent methyltransferase [Alphaproteobacteria bacterium]